MTTFILIGLGILFLAFVGIVVLCTRESYKARAKALYHTIQVNEEEKENTR
jgi:hypothetical protein